MALHDDLLEQAHHLATREVVGPPKQASLRRSVSAAYYSLFHLLVSEAVALLPSAPLSLRLRASRAFSHEEMKTVCAGIASGKPNQATAAVLNPQRFTTELRQVAKAFSDLQDARHRADYDLSQKYTRTDVYALLAQVDAAFADWRLVRASDEGRVFLTALMLQKRWSK